MKKLIMIALFMMSVKVAAPPAPKHLVILAGVCINPYEVGFAATGMVESRLDLFAYNPFEKAYGMVQIREIRLEDYNTRTGSNYTVQDLFDYNISRKIYMYYASRIDYRDPERIAREWNGWVNGMEKASTVEYWKKVKSYLPTCPPKRGTGNVIM
jgi:hypothetical protein